MSKKNSIWLDDKRPMPFDFNFHVYTAQAAIAALETGTVEEISLDHDLGPEEEVGNGYMVACWIEEHAYLGTLPRLAWKVHSQNGVGVTKMTKALQNADRYWNEK